MEKSVMNDLGALLPILLEINERLSSTAAAVREHYKELPNLTCEAADLEGEAIGGGTAPDATHRIDPAMDQQIAQMWIFVEQIAGAMHPLVANAQGMADTLRAIADEAAQLSLKTEVEVLRTGGQTENAAVIAETVRRLAEKSAQSAAGIDAMVQAVVQKSDHLSRVVHLGKHRGALAGDGSAEAS